VKLAPGIYLGATVRQKTEKGLCLTLSQYTPSLTQPWHVHANPTLFALLIGRQRDQGRRAEFDQPRLSLVFHPTTEPHAGLVAPEGMLGLNIEYEGIWLARHEIKERDLGGYRLLDSVWSRLTVLQLMAAAFHRGPHNDADVETKALELLEPLIQPEPGRERLSFPNWLRRAQEFLHESFRSPIRVWVVAREVGVHPVHLARVFRQRYGCSVSEYLRALRLAEAGRLILRKGHTIAQAAHEAGFADQAHLCRCFAAKFGLSPKTFRSAIKTS
jgi:AraC family transcriptional regulator